MAKYRFTRQGEIEAARFDGNLVGEAEPSTGKVHPGTCPDWFPAVVEECAPGGFGWGEGSICGVGDKLYLGLKAGTQTVHPGDYVVKGEKGRIYALDAETFECFYAPV